MINTREFEIRNETLSLTVAAYQMLSDLTDSLSLEIKNRLINDSFLVSSLIAEAFHCRHSAASENDLSIGLNKLLDLKAQALMLKSPNLEKTASLDNFVHIAEELQVELTELLSAIKQLNAETFSPKLEIACI